MNSTTYDSSAIPPVKKQRKPRTKKADMLKKKMEMEKLKLTQVPKKRGRKPKGGKIIKTNFNIDETIIENKIIILHLKCKLSDLNKDNTNLQEYNPNIIKDIVPYDIITNKNHYTLLNHEEGEEEPYNVIPSTKEESPIIETNKDSKNNIKEKNNNKKLINTKLKELEHNLNTNNIIKKSACFWCTFEFNSNPIYIPSLFFQKKYNVYGCFCSPECACAYLFKESIDSNTKFERYQLLNYIYGKIYNYNKEIKPAPNPYYTLNKYYGNLTIQEYRQLLEYDRLILVIDKPLTKIYPELHEDNNEFETVYENKIVLKKNKQINKTNVLNKVFSNESN